MIIHIEIFLSFHKLIYSSNACFWRFVFYYILPHKREQTKTASIIFSIQIFSLSLKNDDSFPLIYLNKMF